MKRAILALLLGALACETAPVEPPPPVVDAELTRGAEQIVTALRARDFEQLKPHIAPELHDISRDSFRSLLEAIDGHKLDVTKVKVHEVREEASLSGIIKSATLILDFEGRRAETIFSSIGGKVNGTAAWLKLL